jgi:hypothetical protein
LVEAESGEVFEVVEQGGAEGLGSAGEGASVGAVEAEVVVFGVAGDGPVAFVDEAVVGPAQSDEVVGVGGAVIIVGGGVDPVGDVVDLADGAITAREPACGVAAHDAPPQPGGDVPGRGADADGGAVGGVDRVFDATVTQQAQHAVAGDGEVADEAVAVDVAVDDGGVDVHDHTGQIRVRVGAQ